MAKFKIFKQLMALQGEIDYLKNIGEGGIRHAFNKPFSDDHCGEYLTEIGSIMSLLIPPPAKLLDLGCGTGWTSCLFAKRGYDVTGQDLSEDMIYYAKLNKDKEKLNNLQFVVGDYEDINYGNQFDCAVFFDSLHHAINEEDALLMAYKALKPDGMCIVSEPGLGHGKKSLEISKKYNTTEKDMSPNIIIKAAKKAGFKKFKIYPHFRHLDTIINGEPQNVFLKKIEINFLRTIAAIFIIVFYKRFDGIVLMKKI